MRRRASSSSEGTQEARRKLSWDGSQHILTHKTSGDVSQASNGTNALSAHLSPLWGDPGRKLPSVSSMLQLPPPLLVSTSSNAASFDIEDLFKEDKQREELLIEELVQASPKVQVEFSARDSLCPRCHRPTCPVSRPPPGYYSERDVAKHKTPGDCWIMANGLVYDCSRYITKHPGGPRAILSRAGLDASKDFDFHTRQGKNMWQRLQVGRVAVCNANLPGTDHTDCTIS